MNEKLREAFDQIQAEEALKSSTKAFLREKTQGYTKARSVRPRAQMYAAVCACLLLLLFGGHWLFFTPTSEISIEINPYFELSVNRFDRVISVKGLNADGRELMASLDIKYRNYADAINRILENERISLLLSRDEVMTITVTGKNEAQYSEILSGIETCTADRQNTYCHYSSSEAVAAAHREGMSCGKYRAYLQLKALDPDISPEDVQNMTMRELLDLIDSLSANGEGSAPSQDSGWENGHHEHGHGH